MSLPINSITLAGTIVAVRKGEKSTDIKLTSTDTKGGTLKVNVNVWGSFYDELLTEGSSIIILGSSSILEGVFKVKADTILPNPSGTQFNHVTVGGHLTQYCDTKEFGQGKTLNKGTCGVKITKDETSWFNFVYFRAFHPAIQSAFCKGSAVVVRGQMITETYTGKSGKNAGKEVTKLTVQASDVSFLPRSMAGKKDNNVQGNVSGYPGSTPVSSTPAAQSPDWSSMPF